MSPSFSISTFSLVIYMRRLYSSVGEAILGCMPINARASVVPERGHPPMMMGASCDICLGRCRSIQRLNRRVS
jgi:hypothetical protein